jgi:hypothetical protein
MSFIHEYSISYCYNMTLELKEDLSGSGVYVLAYLHYPSLSQRIIEIMIFMFPVDILLIGGPAFR